MGERSDAETVVEQGDLANTSFEDHITGLISAHIGKTDRQIADEYSVPYTGGKAQWTTLVYQMLGIRSNRAEEFIKAGISVRAVRIEENGKIKESLSFAPFDFTELLEEDWDSSPFRSYLDETKFFFVVFASTAENTIYKEASSGICRSRILRATPKDVGPRRET